LAWLKRLWGIGWKVGVAVIALLVFAGIYLDSVIKHRFEGQLFDLPTVVYARILEIAPGDNLSIKELRNELDVLNYRKVANPFDENGVQRIQSLEQKGDLGYLRLEPKMLGMLEKDVQEQRLFLRREQFPEVMIDALVVL